MRPACPTTAASTQIVPDSNRRTGTSIRPSRNHRYAVCRCTPLARAHPANFTHSPKHTFEHKYSHSTEQFNTPDNFGPYSPIYGGEQLTGVLFQLSRIADSMRKKQPAGFTRPHIDSAAGWANALRDSGACT